MQVLATSVVSFEDLAREGPISKLYLEGTESQLEAAIIACHVALFCWRKRGVGRMSRSWKSHHLYRITCVRSKPQQPTFRGEIHKVIETSRCGSQAAFCKQIYHEILDQREFSVSMGSTSLASTYLKKKMFERNVPVLNVQLLLVCYELLNNIGQTL